MRRRPHNKKDVNIMGDIIERGGKLIEDTVMAFMNESTHYNNVSKIVMRPHDNIREYMEIRNNRCRRPQFIDEEPPRLDNLNDRIDEQFAMRNQRSVATNQRSVATNQRSANQRSANQMRMVAVRPQQQQPQQQQQQQPQPQPKLFNISHFDAHAVIQPEVNETLIAPITAPIPEPTVQKAKPEASKSLGEVIASEAPKVQAAISSSSMNLDGALMRSMSEVLYLNLLGKDISVVVKRKSGKKELEFFRGGASIPPEILSSSSILKPRRYISEFGMKVTAPVNEKISITEILSRMNVSINESVNTIAFIIPADVYEKINWNIPDKKVWVFTPGEEISGGDAICGCEMYDSFVAL